MFHLYVLQDVAKRYFKNQTYQGFKGHWTEDITKARFFTKAAHAKSALTLLDRKYAKELGMSVVAKVVTLLVTEEVS